MIQAKILELRTKISGGVLPAMATPIQPNNQSINLSIVDQLISFLINSNVNGLFIGGTTGEGILLSSEERRKLHEKAMDSVSSRVPLLLHVGSNSTQESKDLASHAESIGADAIVAVTPYFYPVHDSALLEHFRAVAFAAPNTPLFAYDIPHFAINAVRAPLLTKLSTEIPSFAGVKCSNQDAQIIRELIDAKPEEKLVLVGNERIALGSLALGADGLISGLATALPEPFVHLTKSFFSNDMTKAVQMHQIINGILDDFPPGARIGAIKSLLAHRGIDVGLPIAPRPVPPAVWPGGAHLETWLDQINS